MRWSSVETQRQPPPERASMPGQFCALQIYCVVALHKPACSDIGARELMAPGGHHFKFFNQQFYNLIKDLSPGIYLVNS